MQGNTENPIKKLITVLQALAIFVETLVRHRDLVPVGIGSGSLTLKVWRHIGGANPELYREFASVAVLNGRGNSWRPDRRSG